MRTAVIGVGNEYRRDDGIGPIVIARLARHDLPGVTFTRCDGEPSQLIDAWTGSDLAVVIDAVLCERPEPGRVHRTGLDTLPGSARWASTHGLGIPEAIQLADALDQAPRRLVVYAVEAADLGFGVGLSPAVAAAAQHVERAVLMDVELAAQP